MTVELVVSGATLITVIGYGLRQEARITKLETLVKLLVGGKQLG